MQTIRSIALLFALLLWGGGAQAADQFHWNAATDRVDADIQSWPLNTLLEKISTAAGWDIYLEPGTTHEVSTKFSNLPPDKALPRLLGKLNYALLLQTNNAPPRFYVFHTTMGKATERVGQGKKPIDYSRVDWIPDEIIVVLGPECKSTMEEITSPLGAKILRRDDKNRVYRLKFASVAAAEAALKEFHENDCVASAEPNFRIHKPPPVARSPIASSSPFPLQPTAKNDPNNLVVAVIDTAVQSSAELNPFLLSQVSVAGESAHPDGPMHGTFMAEAVVQNGSANTKILPIDVYGQNGATTTYEIGLGINAAVEGGATIINLSLGTYGRSPYLEKLISHVAGQNVLIFAAAGNDPVNVPVYPASYPGVISVTAGSNGELAPYANQYSGNDLMVPGQSLGHYQGNAFVITGTSSASANAAGLAAALMGRTGANAQQTTTLLQQNFSYVPTK